MIAFSNSISRKVNYPVWVLFNFVVLAIAGAVLRYMHVSSIPAVDYQFLLHAHSHFAFAGWMFLAIILLLFYHFKNESLLLKAQFKQIFILTILVSFGMLISFFLTGYQTASIVLSTCFIFISYWFTFMMFKSNALKKTNHSAVNILLKSSLFFLVISSLGPFFLGYLKGAGFKDMALQQNSIYFYLHFQLNGFMQLALLGLFFKSYLKPNLKVSKNIAFWTKVFAISTLPLYAMFTLWTTPKNWVYVVVFAAALAHLLAWVILISRLKADLKSLSFLAKMALLAMSLQFLFQLLIAVPVIGNWAFSSRNLIIGYIHLLTLGSLSPLIIDLFTRAGFCKPPTKLNYLFIANTVIYLALLFGSVFLAVFKVYLPHLTFYLFVSNLSLPFIALAYFISTVQYQKQKLIAVTANNI